MGEKSRGAAIMAKCVGIPPGIMQETQADALDPVVVSELGFVHFFQGFSLQDASTLEDTAIKQGAAEFEHVSGRGGQRSCRSEICDQFIGARNVFASFIFVGHRHVLVEPFRQWFFKAGIFHAEHVKNILLDIVGKTQTGDVRYHQA